MAWNYRVIEFTDPAHGPWRAIHEVYYDALGAPSSYARNPAVITWEPDQDSDAPARVLERMRRALEMPVLAESDFPAERQGET